MRRREYENLLVRRHRWMRGQTPAPFRDSVLRIMIALGVTAVALFILWVLGG
ncbi:MAG TPA: hypothetical protein VGQ63_03965 [Pseudolabrys sp.]|jgi:hypothetical protein|nr:hypothetical protein [Pseudolabrys sp.]